jgi:transcriptional regulator with XRE-family HTH domain
MVTMAVRQIPSGVKTLGEAVRVLRESQGLTLRALAEKVGVSAPFLSDLEHGRRQTDRHEDLASALGVSAEALRDLDSRVAPELKDWLAENPKLIALLKDMRNSGRPVPLEALWAATRRRR